MASTLPSARLAHCEQLILDAGGRAVDPWPYAAKANYADALVREFGGFLRASGVRHFSALELLTPSSDSQRVIREAGADKSEHGGHMLVVPPVWLWTPIAALTVAFCDPIREALGAPVTHRNGLRPWWLNQQVASSGIASDHPHTAAADLDLSDRGDVRAAHRCAERLYNEHGRTHDVSLGQGPRTIHIAIHGPSGHRRWTYGEGPPR